MPNYKEIARLKAAGQSNRAIADFLGLSRNTVNAAVARIEDSGLSFEDLQILTDSCSFKSLSVTLGSSGHWIFNSAARLHTRATVFLETLQLVAISRSLIPRLFSRRFSRYLVI